MAKIPIIHRSSSKLAPSLSPSLPPKTFNSSSLLPHPGLEFNFFSLPVLLWKLNYSRSFIIRQWWWWWWRCSTWRMVVSRRRSLRQDDNHQLARPWFSINSRWWWARPHAEERERFPLNFPPPPPSLGYEDVRPIKRWPTGRRRRRGRERRSNQFSTTHG